MTGDVYSDEAAARWQELSYGNLFSKGWDKPWSSPPTGGGGAPRQGWLNSYEGVFYRLSIATFGWQHGLNGGDGYNNNLVTFTPLNQRFEIQTDIPIVPQPLEPPAIVQRRILATSRLRPASCFLNPGM